MMIITYVYAYHDTQGSRVGNVIQSQANNALLMAFQSLNQFSFLNSPKLQRSISAT